MDDKTFKERVARLQEIGGILEGLPAEIRAAAFDILQDYVTGAVIPARSPRQPEPQATHPRKREQSNVESDDPAEFFGAFEHDKPADTVKLLAAYLYREHGAQSF